MFRHQVMFVALFSVLLLTFAHADTTPMYSGQRYFNTMKALTDFKSMMSTVVQTIMKHTMNNSTGPLSVVGHVNEHIISAKKSEKEHYETYEKMLKKKENFEELQKKVSQLSSVGSTKEINQKLIEVQATASKGFQKLNEIKNMKEDVNKAIHESEIAGNEMISHFNKSLSFANSLFLGGESEMKNTLFSMPVIIADVLSRISSAKRYVDRVSETLDKLEKSTTEAKKSIDDALKELQEIEAAQKAISAMKHPQALGVKDAHGSIIKDSTSVPSLLSNFACFAGVMMFTVMCTNHL